MAIINPNKPLHVEAIYFKDQPEPLTNCDVFLLDHFAIVFQDQNETTPNWYNVSLIDKMEGVTAEKYNTRIG